MPKTRLARDLAAITPVGAAFVHCVVIGWGRWGDLLTDTGRELELPRRMLEGEALYRDLRWYYGPLAPYVNAWLYRAFGVRVEVLAVAGIASAALVALALWLLTRRFADRFAATAVALSFVYGCAFSAASGAGIFNFALPYTFAATYGMLVAIWSVYFLVRHVQDGRARDLHASIGLLALTAFTKVEVLVPLAAAHGAFALACAMRGRNLRPLLGAYSAAVAFVASVYGLLFARHGAEVWSLNLAGVWNDASAVFIRSMMGLDLPLTNLLWVIGVTSLLVTWTALGAWASRRIPWSALPVVARGGLVAALAGASVGLALLLPWNFPFRAATPVAVGAVIYLAARATVAADGERDDLVARIAVWTFAAGCLLRIFLRPTPVFYGFYLLVPTIAGAGILLFSDLPARLRATGWARTAIVGQAAGVLVGGALPLLLDSLPAYAERAYELETPRGRWRTQYPDLPAAIRSMSELPPEARVLVVPEGAALNFFASRRGPDAMFSYLPMEMPRGEDEARVVDSWARRPPELVVLLSLRNDEFGAGWFGIDYGRRCGQWIERNYRPIALPNSGVMLAVPAGRTP